MSAPDRPMSEYSSAANSTIPSNLATLPLSRVLSSSLPSNVFTTDCSESMLPPAEVHVSTRPGVPTRSDPAVAPSIESNGRSRCQSTTTCIADQAEDVQSFLPSCHKRVGRAAHHAHLIHHTTASDRTRDQPSLRLPPSIPHHLFPRWNHSSHEGIALKQAPYWSEWHLLTYLRSRRSRAMLYGLGHFELRCARSTLRLRLITSGLGIASMLPARLSLGGSRHEPSAQRAVPFVRGTNSVD